MTQTYTTQNKGFEVPDIHANDWGDEMQEIVNDIDTYLAGVDQTTITKNSALIESLSIGSSINVDDDGTVNVGTNNDLTIAYDPDQNVSRVSDSQSGETYFKFPHGQSSGAIQAGRSINTPDGTLTTESYVDNTAQDTATTVATDIVENQANTMNSESFINVAKPPYNAPKLGDGDGTTAIQQAIDDIPANGGTLFFPYMVLVTDTLDATNRRNLCFTASHGRNQSGGGNPYEHTGGVHGEIDGKPILDTSGGFCYVFKDGFAVTANQVKSIDNNTPNIGILLARSEEQDWGPAHDFCGARITGSYSQASLYNISKEVGSVRNCYLTNTLGTSNARTIEHNSDNPEGVTSEFVTIPDIQSCTQWYYGRNTFIKSGEDGNCIRFGNGTAGHCFVSNYVFTTGEPFILFNANGGGIHGPYTFIRDRLEGRGQFMKKIGPDTLHSVHINAGRTAAPYGSLPAIEMTGRVEGFNLLDMNDGHSFKESGIVGGDFRNSRIISGSPIDIDIDSLIRSNVELYHHDSILTVSGANRSNQIRTQMDLYEHRQNFGGRLHLKAYGSPPVDPEYNDVVLQNGVGWNPTGSGNRELVVWDGDSWEKA